MVAAVETMAYTGEVPWHNLGVKVDPDMTPEQMMQAAKLDWTVEKHDVFFKEGKKYHNAPKKKALVRSSDGAFLDIVSDNWIPVQNRDAFEFFNKYVKAGGMSMETAGSLKDGQIIWGLAKINEQFELFGGDLVEAYLLLANPHNYGRGVDIRSTNIRVVCNNTLALALNAKAGAVSLSLNHRTEFDVEKVQAAIEQSKEHMAKYKEMAEFLGSKRYNQETLMRYFDTVFPVTTPKKQTTAQVIDMFDRSKTKTRGAPKRERSHNAELAHEVLEQQPGHEFAEGSFWQAYNAVSYMTDHMMGRGADTRLQSAWYGQNANRKVVALQTAIEMAQAA